MGWLQTLQARWKVNSVFQVLIILLVFACTGITVVLIKEPLLTFLFEEDIPLWAWVIYYVLILPFYNVILLIYGLIFGQFKFFWAFEKRFLKRIISIFRR